MELVDAKTQKYDIGRCAIFRSEVWDGSTNLFDDMTHIGNTEGAVEPEPNAEYSELNLPETSGPAAIKRYLVGEKPSFNLGIFPNPTNLALFSPTGKGSAGQQRRRKVKEHTLWIVPEELFLAEDDNGNTVEKAVTFAGGVFLKDGNALTAAELELVNISMVLWRADFGRAIPAFRHENGGKSLKSVPVNVQQDFEKPDGCQLYLMVGEADDFEIDFEGSYS